MGISAKVSYSVVYLQLRVLCILIALWIGLSMFTQRYSKFKLGVHISFQQLVHMTEQCGPSKLGENQTQGQPKLAVQALGFRTLIL